MNIFVAKLSPETDNTSLQELFENYGVVDSAKVIFDRDTGNSKGYGFVEMPNDEEALQAIEALNETEFDGNSIVVKKARPRENQRRNNTRNFRR